MTAEQRPERPTVAAAAPWQLGEPTESRLASGLRVLVFDRPGQHVVSAGLVIEAPLSLEPRDREGVAELTAGTLDQGTASHPGTTFADAVESCGAAFEASAGFSATQVYLDVPVTRLDAGLALMAEAVREPELSDADVARHRALRLAQLDQQLAHGATLADIALRHALIDPASRQARMRAGERADVERVTGADVRAFHAAWYRPDAATLVLAGDVGGLDAHAAAERAFASWGGAPGAAVVHEQPTPRAPEVVLVDRPGSVQADVRLARWTIDRRDPRWADFQVATYILGGAFLSRLNAELREARGFTYGVHAGTAPLRSGGYTTISGSFRTEVVAEALALVPGLIDVAARPFTAAEVEDARTYLLGVQPLTFATAGGVCNSALALLAAGLEPGFVNEVRTRLRAVTPESASAAAALLPPDGLTVVVVGDAATLAPALRAQGHRVRLTDPASA